MLHPLLIFVHNYRPCVHNAHTSCHTASSQFFSPLKTYMLLVPKMMCIWTFSAKVKPHSLICIEHTRANCYNYFVPDWPWRTKTLYTFDLTKTFNGFTAVNPYLVFRSSRGNIRFLTEWSWQINNHQYAYNVAPSYERQHISKRVWSCYITPPRPSEFWHVFQDPSLDEDSTAWENMDYHGILYGISRNIRGKRSGELLKIGAGREEKNS